MSKPIVVPARPGLSLTPILISADDTVPVSTCFTMLGPVPRRLGHNHGHEAGPVAGGVSESPILAALDPGPAHDWVRAAVGEPSSTKR